MEWTLSIKDIPPCAIQCTQSDYDVEKGQDPSFNAGCAIRKVRGT